MLLGLSKALPGPDSVVLSLNRAANAKSFSTGSLQFGLSPPQVKFPVYDCPLFGVVVGNLAGYHADRSEAPMLGRIFFGIFRK